MRRRPPPSPRARWQASAAAWLVWLASCGGGAPTPPALALPAGLESVGRREVREAHAALVAAPGDVNRWVRLGRLAERNALAPLARAAFEGAAALQPKAAAWPYRSGIAAQDSLDAAAARAAYERAVALDPNHAAAWRRLGQLALEDGQLDAARAAFTAVDRLQPRWPDGPAGLALVALAADAPADAVKSVEVALRRRPDLVGLRHLMGVALRAAGRMDEAAPHLLAAEGAMLEWSELPADLATFEAGDAALLAEADARAAAAELGAAAELYRRVLARRPRDGRATTRLAVVLAAAGQGGEALALLEPLLDETPDNVALLLGRATVEQILGQTDAAFATAQRVTGAHPNLADGWIHMGELHLSRGDLGAARAAFERAYAVEPFREQTSARLARDLVRAREAQRAAQVLEEALQRVDGAPSLEHFKFVLEVQRLAGRAVPVRQRTCDAARRFHGAAARELQP